MHGFLTSAVDWGFRQVANYICQPDDVKTVPFLAMAEEPPCETELRVLGLHHAVRYGQVLAHKDICLLFRFPARSRVLETKYQPDPSNPLACPAQPSKQNIAVAR